MAAQGEFVDQATLIASRRLLGLTSPRQVVFWAAEQVADGVEASALVDLAAMSNPRADDVDNAIDRLLREIEAPTVDELGAALLISRYVAMDIVAGRVTPIEGAREIWRKVALSSPAAEPLLRDFIGLASEWDDVPAQRPEYEADIREAAQRLIAAQSGPTTTVSPGLDGPVGEE
jgi:hypothetical protein